LQLRFDSDIKDKGILMKYSWVNEALTELISAKLGEFDPVAYSDERKAFEEMLRVGESRGHNPKELERKFIHAYQEDYAIGKAGAVPRTQAVYDLMRELMGREWLDAQDAKFEAAR
jgi:hypothetical protein